jgi:predicted YcjX-like family ATPase
MANWTDETRIALDNMRDSVTGLFVPTIRLGVTGLSRAGKTVFITSMIQNLIEGDNLSLFAPLAEGRLIGAQLSPHPNAAMPRFAYEEHLKALKGEDRHWPQSTRQISQVRLTLKFQPDHWATAWAGPREVHLDIVDYPGEWLLDLPLLDKSYREWSDDALQKAHAPARANIAEEWLNLTLKADAAAPLDEELATRLSNAFKAYLQACRADEHALSALPPGRFLMPGDMDGSPALTFAPLPAPDATSKSESLYAQMERRYEAYKNIVVRPFFRDHFARLDRQIILVDALTALNAGSDAVTDLEKALGEILTCFKTGNNPLWTRFFSTHIDKILFAATKADHMPHTNHDRLGDVLGLLVKGARQRAHYQGAETQSMALAAIRATHEGEVEHEGKMLKTIIGTPQKGESLGDKTYDGNSEIALYPGNLPENPDSIFEDEQSYKGKLKFLRFRPPVLDNAARQKSGLPHIRLDRALDFLLGDKLQ